MDVDARISHHSSSLPHSSTAPHHSSHHQIYLVTSLGVTANVGRMKLHKNHVRRLQPSFSHTTKTHTDHCGRPWSRHPTILSREPCRRGDDGLGRGLLLLAAWGLGGYGTTSFRGRVRWKEGESISHMFLYCSSIFYCIFWRCAGFWCLLCLVACVLLLLYWYAFSKLFFVRALVMIVFSQVSSYFCSRIPWPTRQKP